MPKEKREVVQQNHGMTFLITFVILFVVNAVFIHLANMFFPMHVVLGTMSMSRMWALLLASGVLSIVGTLAMPVLTEVELRRKRILSPAEMMGAYAVINFVALWLMSRAAEILGMGLASWMTVLILALVLDVVQGGAMVGVMKMIKK